MKAASIGAQPYSFLRQLPAVFHKFPKPTLPFNLRRPISSSSSSSSSSLSHSSPRSQIPLFLKSPIHSTTLSQLHQWLRWAKTFATAAVSSTSTSGDALDAVILHRELRWLLQDALEDPSLSLNDVDDDRVVRLRTSVQDLYVLWRRRIEERRPFQYVVGCEHWRDLVLCVQEGVLIPRPETELIVDLVAEVVSRNVGLGEGMWADLGTGSGALAIGIARVLGSRGRVVATDLSPVAIGIASFNVQRYGLQEIIDIRQGSWCEPLKDVEGKLAGLVSNPPYIPSGHISGLQAEVGKHEPRLALDGGMDGMDDLLHLCSRTASMLKSGGFFAFETNGEKQCKFLVEYITTEFEGSFFDVKTAPDFAGIQRFVTGFHQ